MNKQSNETTPAHFPPPNNEANDGASVIDTEISNFIRAMPKAEIHVHLEGAVQPQTVLELARRHNQLAMLPAT